MPDQSSPLDEDLAGGAVRTADSISPTESGPFGRRAFIAGAAGAAVATALSTSAHAAVPAGASYYQAVGPVRLADTRNNAAAAPYKDYQTFSGRGKNIRVDILGRDDVPDDAVSVVVTLTGVFNGTAGFIQAVPAGGTNTVSNINLSPGDGAVANLATVTIKRDVATSNALYGKIDVKSPFGSDIIVDVVGVYRATSTEVVEGRLKFLPETRRIVENRRMTNNDRVTVSLNGVIPNTAQAVVVNLTAASTLSAGFFRAFASGETPPFVSNVNWVAGDTRAVGAIVAVGSSGGRPAIDVFCRGNANLFIDVTGYITGPDDADVDRTEGLFIPISPNRVLDTRRKADRARSGKGRLWPRWRREFQLPQNTAGFGARSQMSGIAMNTTLVSAMQLGWATALAARTPLQRVSNLNVSRVGHVVANHVISRASTAGVEIYAMCGGDVIADVAGWYTGSPQRAAFSSPLADPPAPAPGFNWLLTVPSLQKRFGGVLQNWVIPDLVTGDRVVDGGNSWHWTNTGLLNQAGASIVAFAHRTTHGGPLYNQHLLQPGAELILDTLDGRQYKYRFVRDELTNAAPANILAAARRQSGSTFTLVACTGDGRTGALSRAPGGSIRWRIVSTFVLVDTPSGGFVDTTPTID